MDQFRQKRSWSASPSWFSRKHFRVARIVQSQPADTALPGRVLSCDRVSAAACHSVIVSVKGSVQLVPQEDGGALVCSRKSVGQGFVLLKNVAQPAIAPSVGQAWS